MKFSMKSDGAIQRGIRGLKWGVFLSFESSAPPRKIPYNFVSTLRA